MTTLNRPTCIKCQKSANDATSLCPCGYSCEYVCHNCEMLALMHDPVHCPSCHRLMEPLNGTGPTYHPEGCSSDEDRMAQLMRNTEQTLTRPGQYEYHCDNCGGRILAAPGTTPECPACEGYKMRQVGPAGDLPAASAVVAEALIEIALYYDEHPKRFRNCGTCHHSLIGHDTATGCGAEVVTRRAEDALTFKQCSCKMMVTM